MKSKTSFFNCGLFKSNLKRFWPVFAVYFAVLLLCMPMDMHSYSVDGAAVAFTVRDYIEDLAYFINPLMALAVGMCVFGFMFNQRSCGMIASLPVKRGSVFATALISGIVPVLVINLVIALISAIPLISSPDDFGIKALVIWFAVTSMQYVFFFGFAAIVAVITGNVVAFPVFYVIFNFLAVGIESAVREILHVFVFGFTNNGNAIVAEALSPIVKLAGLGGFATRNEYVGEYAKLVSFRFTEWGINLIYFGVGIAFMVLAILIYRRRKMENCGDVVAIPALRSVFRWGVAICFALCGAVLLGSIFDSGSAVSYMIYMAIGAFAGWFGAGMLLDKSLRVFRSNWGGFIIILVLCAAFIAGSVFDVFGVGDTPDAEKIENISIDAFSDSPLMLTDEDSINAVIDLNESILKNKDEHLNADWGYVFYVGISYFLDNGQRIYREYPVSTFSADFDEFLDVIMCDEAKEFYTTPDVPVIPENIEYKTFSAYDYANDESISLELTGEQAADFFLNAYTPDVMAGYYFGTSMIVLNHNPPEFYTEHAYIEIQFINSENGSDDAGGHMFFCCIITPGCENSIQWVKDNLGIDLEEIYASTGIWMQNN